MHRYDTNPNRVMNPPSTEHTMLKFVTASVGIVSAVQFQALPSPSSKNAENS